MKWVAVATAAAIGAGAAFTLDHDIINTVTPACVIKGNISHNTGERIYHLPGDEYYDDTVISLAEGERWFCSQAEARAAGWRRARR